jgi:high affinity Mn2+ porin
MRHRRREQIGVRLASDAIVFPRIFLTLTVCALFAPVLANAQNGSPGPRDEEQSSLMKTLTEHGLHNLEDERWNVYGQYTYISSWKPAFTAPYTNLNGSINSLLPGRERSFSGSATLYFGARLWRGAEAYVAPELISERPLSDLKGLGSAIQNFELQKGGEEIPQVYHSRILLRQTIGLGGHRVAQESGPLELGTTHDSRRLVFAAGNFTILDFFDHSALDIDPRQGFLSLGFMTYGAYDFASDARGYSYGGVAELYWDTWAARFARITPPKDPNQLPVDFRLGKYYGDQFELEHKHQVHGRIGTLRALAYRNREKIGRFSDALAAYRADPRKNAAACLDFNYGSDNGQAPDLCWVRKPNVKLGVGLFGEQSIARDIAVFSRVMIADGKTEVGAYTSTDRSAAFGALAKGSTWSRARDVAGAGVGLGWISHAHAEYLRLGGVDGFIGDGTIRPAAEKSLDLFYSVYVRGTAMWVTGDYQRIHNPGFNADRGPVNIFTLRVHGEF